ncbi:MAG: hypothetical protein KatS3mg105_3606 [Gemmatales bacterium]|nr:MAG: hypothetical protein KatS3mg105_3606 [Gemmatales bacterium]
MAKPNEAPPRNDAYVGMLVISLGAMILGCVLLFIDYNQYGESKPVLPPRPLTAKQLAEQAKKQPPAPKDAAKAPPKNK